MALIWRSQRNSIANSQNPSNHPRQRSSHPRPISKTQEPKGDRRKEQEALFINYLRPGAKKFRRRTCSPCDCEFPPSSALLSTVPSSCGTRPHAVGAPLTGRNPKSISIISLRPSGSIVGITTSTNSAPAIRFSRKENILVSSTQRRSARFYPWTPSRIRLRSRAGISRTCARTATAILTRPRPVDFPLRARLGSALPLGSPFTSSGHQCLEAGLLLFQWHLGRLLCSRLRLRK